MTRVTRAMFVLCLCLPASVRAAAVSSTPLTTPALSATAFARPASATKDVMSPPNGNFTLKEVVPADPHDRMPVLRTAPLLVPDDLGKSPRFSTEDLENLLKGLRVEPLLSRSETGGEPETAAPVVEPVVVTASRVPQRLAETADAIAIVTAADVRMNHATDLGGALERAPGTEVTRYGPAGATSSVAVRGSRPAQTLVMVDGRSVNSPVTGDANPSLIVPGTMDRIEVLRGPSGLLYGSNAVGGVVNVLTPPAPAVLAGSFGGEVGTFGTVTRRVSLGGPVGPTRWLLAEERTVTAGARSNGAFRGENLWLKMEALDQPRVTVTAGRWESILGVSGPRPAADPAKRTASQVYFGDEDAASTFDRQDDRVQHVDARADLTPWSNHEISVRSFVEIAGNTFRQGYYAGPFYGNPEDRESATGTQAQGLSAQYSLPLSPNSESRVTGGVEWRKDRLNGNQDAQDLTTSVWTHTAGIRGRVETGSAFAEWKLRPPAVLEVMRGLNLAGGVRWDHHSRFGGITNLHGGVAYDAGPVTFKTSGGSAFRAPTLSEMFWPEGPYEAGNPNLKPERGQTFEAGVEHRTGGLESRIGVFQRVIRDQIDWTPDTKGVWRPSNVGLVVTRGDEAEASIRRGAVTVGGTVTVIRATQRKDEVLEYDTAAPWGPVATETRDRVAAHVPRYMAAANLEVDLPEGTTVSLVGHGSGERLMYLEDLGTAYPRTVTVTKRLKPYATATLRVSRTFAPGVEAYAGIENLTDTHYVSHFGRSGIDPDNQDYPMPGRTFFAGATTRW